MIFEFNEERHEYQLNGVVIPGVTTVIRPLYSLDGPSEAVLEYAAGRGRAVHKACEIYNLGQQFSGPLDSVIQPYFEAWLKFLHEKRVTITGAEQQLYHPTMKYAGTFDAIGTMEDSGDDDWTFDIKAIAKLHASIGVQLAAYSELRKNDGVKLPAGARHRRAAIQLKPDGKYVFQEYSNYSDFPTFLSCLNVHNFRMNHHIGEENAK